MEENTWRFSHQELLLQPSGNLLYQADSSDDGSEFVDGFLVQEGPLLPHLEDGSVGYPVSSPPTQFEARPDREHTKKQRGEANKQILRGPTPLQPSEVNLVPVKLENKPPLIEVIHSDFHPYPKFWIKKNTLRPAVLLNLVNVDSFNLNNLTVMAVAMDPHTQQPISSAKLTNDSVGIDEELSLEMKKPTVKFSELKIYGDRSLGGKKGNDIQLAFCVYNKQTFPPSPICFCLEPTTISVFNRFDELPAPNIFKIIPNRVVCRQQTNVTVIGQFFKETKGKQSRQSKTMCGVTLRNDLDIYPNSMEELFPLSSAPQYTYTVKNADTHTFTIPFCCNDVGYVLLNASNDGKNFGLGKLVEVQREPSFSRTGEMVNQPSGGRQYGNYGGEGFGGSNNNQSKGSSRGNSNMDLEASSFYGNFTQLQNLIYSGAKVNVQDENGNSPLALACLQGHVACSDLLLRNAANVNSRDKMGETPLHQACRHGHTAIVKSLILYGADINVENSEGCTPLHLAATGGHLDIVNMLLPNVESVDSTDYDNMTPLHYAVLTGQANVVELICKELVARELTLDSKDSLGFTALHWAVSLNKPKIVQTLVSNGAELNKKTVEDETALFIAVKSSAETVVKILMEAGANPDVKNNLGQIALDVAETEEIKNLLKLKVVKRSPKPGSFSRPSSPKQPQVEEAQDPLVTELEKLRLENKKLALKNKELVEQIKLKSPAKPRREKKERTTTDIIEEEKSHVPYSGDNDHAAEDWWKSKFHNGSATFEHFIEELLKSFPDPSLSEEDSKIAQKGIRDYFENTVRSSKEVTYQHLNHFLKLYGSIEGSQARVVRVYKQKYFHGFIAYEEAASLLKGQVGAYLVRYSQSLLDKGCFVLNVNRGPKKGAQGVEMIENYVVLWHAQQEYFSFYKKTYDSLQSFVQDPMYAKFW